jgi:3-(3-hydroxy-phenyl)propionate hydroxylase
MPVWQGQGYNSGLRDAFNIAWKLALVLKGVCAPSLLDTYQQERKSHAKAMINISVTAGRIFSPTNRAVAKFRDVAFRTLTLLPSIKRYITELRFKPMPRFEQGVVVHDPSLGKKSAVGRIFIQPRVTLTSGETMRLDDAIGNRFAVITWAADAGHWLDGKTRSVLDRLDAKVVTIRPMEQLSAVTDLASDTLLLGDSDGILKIWFGRQPRMTVIVRPDRIIAATCFPASIGTTLDSVADKLGLNSARHTAGPSNSDCARSTTIVAMERAAI